MNPMRTFALLLLAAALCLGAASCGNRQPADTQQTTPDSGRYTNEEIEEYRKVLTHYLTFSQEDMAQVLSLGNQVGLDATGSQFIHPDSLMPQAQQTTRQARDLLTKCNHLLDNREMKALHDLVYDHRDVFYSSPVATLDDETALMALVVELATREYPSDERKQNQEAQAMLDYRLTRIKMMETFENGDASGPMHVDHVNTAMLLMNMDCNLGQYDEAISLGEETLAQLIQNDPQNPQGLELVEELANIYERAGQPIKAEQIRSYLNP